jgi:hypothetical protein
MLSESRKYIKHIYEIEIIAKPVKIIEATTPL